LIAKMETRIQTSAGWTGGVRIQNPTDAVQDSEIAARIRSHGTVECFCTT
jgi:hypothetical protein